MFDIRDYGALGKGELATACIQKAIDEASIKGGTVWVPAGEYTIGTLYLKSHVELHLEHGAKLIASTDLSDYNPDDIYPENHICIPEEWNAKHLFVAYEVEDVALTGDGVIDGSGDFFYCAPKYFSAYTWAEGLALSKDKKNFRPGQTAVFVGCKHVRVEGVRLENATCWGFHFHRSVDVTVRGIRVFNHPTYANTDGIDIDCCKDVTVSDSVIDTGDDCIAIRADSARFTDTSLACENIAITNCVLASSSSAFRIGVGISDIRHVRISNIVIHRAAVGLHLMCDWNKNYSTGLQDIHASHISMTNTAYPITISGGKDKGAADITIEDVTAECSAACIVRSQNADLTHDISLRHVSLKIKDRPIELTDAVKNERGRKMVILDNVKDLKIEGLTLRYDAGTEENWDGVLSMKRLPGLSLSGLEIPD